MTQWEHLLSDEIVRLRAEVERLRDQIGAVLQLCDETTVYDFLGFDAVHCVDVRGLLA